MNNLKTILRLTIIFNILFFSACKKYNYETAIKNYNTNKKKFNDIKEYFKQLPSQDSLLINIEWNYTDVNKFDISKRTTDRYKLETLFYRENISLSNLSEKDIDKLLKKSILLKLQKLIKECDCYFISGISPDGSILIGYGNGLTSSSYQYELFYKSDTEVFKNLNNTRGNKKIDSLVFITIQSAAYN